MQSGAQCIPAPPAARVWSAFWELDSARRWNGFGAEAISHFDMLAYQTLAGIRLRDWERRAIVLMDRERVSFLNIPEQKRDTVVSERPMTPELFDALFA